MPPDTRARRRKSDSGQLAPGVVLGDGKYRVLSLLASGGMGHVYIAEQTPLGRKVALKVLRTPEREDAEVDATVAEHFRKRFFREASILSKLQHVNVVTLYDYGRIEGDPERYFMAMEYLDGDTLAQRIDNRGPMPADATLRVVRQVARGLREAHKLGAVHRDLKPSNIVLVPDEDGGEIVKILDFGIGKLLGGPEEQDLTQEGAFLGSPKYVAPEQVNERRVDARTDVYSLGVIAYECLTGALPFQTETNLEMILAHCSAPVPEMSRRAPPSVRVPTVVEAFVRRCLEKSPADRPQSMEEVLRAVAECEQALGVSSVGSLPSVAGSGSGSASSAKDLRIEPSSQPTTRRDSTQSTLASNVREEQAAPAPAPESPNRSRIALVVVATAVTMGLLAGVVVARRGAHAADDVAQGAASGPGVPASAPQTSASFAMTIDSTPQGADVVEGDRLLGTTPVQISIDRASVQGAPRRFVLRLDGYTPYTLLQGDSTTPVDVIAPLVAAAPTASAPPAATPRSASTPAGRPAPARPPAAKPDSRDSDIKLTR